MNQIEIVKRSARLVWHHRLLWLLGFLTALAASLGTFGQELRSVATSIPRLGELLSVPAAGSSPTQTGVNLAALGCCLLLGVVGGTIFMYLFRAALIRASDAIANQVGGECTLTWREGIRLGWTGRTARLLVLELAIGVPVGIVTLLVLGVGAAPWLLLRAGVIHDQLVGIVVGVVVGLLALIVLLGIFAAYTVLWQFWSREVLLGDRSVGESVFGGITLVREHLKDVAVMWLVMLGLRITQLVLTLGFGIGTRSIAKLAIAVVLLTMSAGTLPALLGIVLLFVLADVPDSAVSGLYMGFQMTVWSIVYREVTGETLSPASVIVEG